MTIISFRCAWARAMDKAPNWPFVYQKFYEILLRPARGTEILRRFGIAKVWEPETSGFEHSSRTEYGILRKILQIYRFSNDKSHVWMSKHHCRSIGQLFLFRFRSIYSIERSPRTFICAIHFVNDNNNASVNQNLAHHRFDGLFLANGSHTHLRISFHRFVVIIAPDTNNWWAMSSQNAMASAFV